jgi:hypothetical protein
MTSQSPINIGACSWKYDSWQGLVYSDRKEIEEQTGNDWSEIVAPQDGDLQSLAAILGVKVLFLQITCYVLICTNR